MPTPKQYYQKAMDKYWERQMLPATHGESFATFMQSFDYWKKDPPASRPAPRGPIATGRDVMERNLYPQG